MSGKLLVTLAIVDHGAVMTTASSSSSIQLLDTRQFFQDNSGSTSVLAKGKSSIEQYYRQQKAAGQMSSRDMMQHVVDKTNAHLAVVVDDCSSENRTMINLRRIENALAECLRSAEDIREQTTTTSSYCDDDDTNNAMTTVRGAVNRIFEHLHVLYQDCMETNVTPSLGHGLSYDQLSGLKMAQKLKGTLTLRRELTEQAARMRDYVAQHKSHELHCFDLAMSELKSVPIPADLEHIFDGSYLVDGDDAAAEPKYDYYCDGGANKPEC
jgi:hypothetical protein